MEDDSGESEPDDGMASDNDDEENSNPDAPNTCASENAEIEKLTQDIAHFNLYQKPQGDQAIELLTAERDDLLKKLAWMTSERDREHKSFMNEFKSGLGTNDALIAAQKEAFVTNNQLERCKHDIDRLMGCPKRKCFFIICI